MKPLRHRRKKRADLFRNAVQLQYKSHMMESDVEESGIFVKTDPKILKYGGKFLHKMVKSRLELHHGLKSTL